jgi:hypothetical protein
MPAHFPWRRANMDRAGMEARPYPNYASHFVYCGLSLLYDPFTRWRSGAFACWPPAR